MKRLALLLGLSLFFPVTAYASSATSTVINNYSSSSTNTSSQVNAHTDITVETDGKVTHYESDEPNKTIHVESKNGNSSIEVNGKEVSGSGDQANSPTITRSPSSNDQKVAKDQDQKNFLLSLFQVLEQRFKALTNIFHFD